MIIKRGNNIIYLHSGNCFRRFDTSSNHNKIAILSISDDTKNKTRLIKIIKDKYFDFWDDDYNHISFPTYYRK